MRIQTTRFGPLDVEASSILRIHPGLLGFETRHRYVLLQTEENPLFQWLQCVDDPALAFVVVDPVRWFPDYEVILRNEDAAALGIEDPDDAGILAIVTLPARLEEMTANLLGPIVVNVRTRRAKQVVLDDPRYHTRHRLLPQPLTATCAA
ncbi:MAG: flagellar assembly protein FliW [Armatimonadetes bacterium]|jgi:flagellar assembly factor FliW|nr:flagellar assembly protein FliW [Armatimonadota bacterium]HOM81390.1 flagellar assembly protein FliW [Armatimonadota bacterium]HPO72821.1 flagellar assembly protein FliW [Armatimonadota bacterium]